MSPLIIRLSGSLGPVEKSSPAPVRPVARILSHRGLPLGGDDGIRTHDPLLAGQVLSQLSYTPVLSVRVSHSCDPLRERSRCRP